MSRGSSAPLGIPRLFFFYRTVSSSPFRNLRHLKFQAGMCAQEQQSVREVTSSRPCPSEQEISRTLLGGPQAAQWRLQLREVEAPAGPRPTIDLATKGPSTTAAAV